LARHNRRDQGVNVFGRDLRPDGVAMNPPSKNEQPWIKKLLFLLFLLSLFTLLWIVVRPPKAPPTKPPSSSQLNAPAPARSWIMPLASTIQQTDFDLLSFIPESST
jgi:hypothetical protein